MTPSPTTPPHKPEPKPQPTSAQPSPEARAQARGTQDADAAAWDRQTLADPHAREDKPTRVRTMFAAIAKSYDLNNHVHSLGIDHLWRRTAVRAAGVRAGETVADIACGTGDLTQAFAKHTEAARVIGIDYTPEMLDIARQKQPRQVNHDRIEYRDGDALRLELDDASVDVVSIAFGIRNVGDIPRALAEFRRVLRPGGRLVVLEFDRPRFAPIRWANDLYCGAIMPRTATLISGDRSGAYLYLPRSVETFLTREDMLKEIGGAGFQQATHRTLTLGVAACYRAVRPD